ncbi:HlyD family efflux transporter periplasmic adaptor subunit [Acidimangrovimonas sediminis]|uniref:HlyD family efflux transporter periplasmic adaptor subunit n=1 Tax=Acidimangrovimonas sediminis TaxID=2056283 RepID=UPI000C7FB9D9|nr:HlyD family secretion protein [Acidimangrovimonas sediminis]
MMRYVKLVVGVMLLLLVVWIVVGEQLSGASADATINAPVVTLRSPVAGIVDMPRRQVGSSVVDADVIATVNDPAPDRIRLSDLQMERDKAAAQLQMLQAQLGANSAQVARMKARTRSYQTDLEAELELELTAAQKRLALMQRTEPPTKGQAGHPGTAVSLDLNRAQERVDLLTNRLSAVRDGVFLGDGYNDAPFSEQHAQQLGAAGLDLTARIVAAKADVAAVDRRLKAARQDVSRGSSARIEAQVDGLYWQPLTADGSYVNRGDPVARMVDCRAELVTASVSENIYQRLHRGMSARFRVLGQDKTFDAVIVRLAGAGAQTVNSDMAVAPSEKHLQRYDVAVAVPGLASDPDLSCAIGRTGRVFFEARPLDWLRGLF